MKYGLLRRVALGVVLCGAFGAAQAQVVISQVYGGGGNSGATLKSDFIELRNNGATAVDLTGWSVQYASAAGTSWTNKTALSGSIQPGGYYLVKQADGAGGTTDLPTPDATGTIAMAGTAGKVALVSNNTALSGACPSGGGIVDFVGYGSTATCAETAPTGTLSNTTAALRNGDGSVDTNNNSADFSIGTPNPRNSSAEPPQPEPATPRTIPQIQGNGLVSPHVGEKVVTEGIVTARKFNNGFFLQSANDDGDPATSEGVFVFTSSAPPASAAVGNRVRVTAKVEEFTPSTNPNQLSITELSSPTVEVLETGVALPAPVEITAAELNANAAPGTLEKLEGMRVSVAHAIAISGTDGSIDEDDAIGGTDSVFYVKLPETATPFREPGIGVLDVIPIPADKNPPRFDTNPERLMVRARQQIGAASLSLDGGAQVDGLVGVLDYYSATWALLPDATSPPTVTGGKLPEAVADPAYEDVTIGGFNLLRFFDEVADGDGAPTLKAAAVDKRLGKTAWAICDYLKAPDILGVVEVEHLAILQRLADRINTTCARAPGYVAYLVEGNDVGGIDVGFLVSTRSLGASPRVEVLDVQQIGKNAVLANPDGSSSLLNDRPPLVLHAVVHQDNGASYPVTVIANHLRSLNDIDSIAAGSNGWPTAGARVRAKRAEQARFTAQLVQDEQIAHPGSKIVMVGDFNAFEFNDGYTDVLGIIKGEEAPEDQVLTWVPSPLTSILIDGSQLIGDPAQRYSYVFEGNAQSLDHVLVNEALALDDVGLSVDHARINADFGVFHYGDAATPLRVSDHDPVRLSIKVPAFRSANLSVQLQASSATAHVGSDIGYTARVGNTGPNAAAFAAVAFVFDALLSPAVTAADGWTCAAPVQDAATTTVTCATPSLASGASADFALTAIAPDSAGGKSLGLAAAVQSQITDPANADNQASVSVGIEASADLAVSLSGPKTPSGKLNYGRTETFPLTLRNNGADKAWNPSVTLRGDALAANVAIAAPAGWQCEVGGDGANFEATCRFAGAFAAGASQRFDFAIVIPARPSSIYSLNLDAAATASTPDPQTANNAARYSNRIVGVP
ncbi:lamin tail domain-containing protein [Pseudoxanthomonas helianthi]|uniref:Lamin tail domain-containing protein n=1 Tax=Pseudoxanthomonas helianthi TaxID=1453541 RepID=A0A941AUI1_9GAMM|nr:lamin tail domain-containing protein [Pseudoxanthomonas helianthi]MBP3983193.1 lamin tail domain-containing protein [Pseudoxanthomonas helianthi]